MLLFDLLPLLLGDACVPSEESEVTNSYSSFLLDFFSYLQGLARKMAVDEDFRVGLESKYESL